MRPRVVLIALAAALIAPAAAAAAPTSDPTPRSAVRSPATTKLGKQLVTRYWRLLKANDRAGLRAFLSPAFQVQRADGTGATKQEYIPTIGVKVIIVNFRLSGFKVTRSRDILVARFVAQTDQVIDGQTYSKDPEPRIATFAQTPRGWQITSNANFNAPPKTTT